MTNAQFATKVRKLTEDYLWRLKELQHERLTAIKDELDAMVRPDHMYPPDWQKHQNERWNTIATEWLDWREHAQRTAEDYLAKRE